MKLRKPTSKAFVEYTSKSLHPTPPMFVTVYDINCNVLMKFEAPSGCQLESLASWITNDVGFEKYMYHVRFSRRFNKYKCSDFIVEVTGKTEYARFVGSYYHNV
jgi:hypothetical protein